MTRFHACVEMLETETTIVPRFFSPICGIISQSADLKAKAMRAASRDHIRKRSLMTIRVSSLVMLLTAVVPIMAAENLPPVSSLTGELSRCKIVASRVDENTKIAEITLESATGIFTFDYRPPKLALKKVSFIVLKEASCEGLTLRTQPDKAIELKEIEGCNFRRQGENLIVDITGLALRTLSAGGKVQFVNAYR